MMQLIRSRMHTPAFLVLLVCAPAAFADTIIRSNSEQTNLIELYTSEGCSSCPPADQWLSTLISHPALWTQVIPIAFHVDYWDYIGWKDRFAQPGFADRQRRYASENSLRAIYTPGLFFNGKEWRNFSWKEPRTRVTPNAGLLVAEIGENEFDIRYQPEHVPSELGNVVVNTAILGFGVTSNVRNGENVGRKLKHDFVVLEYQQATMQLIADAYQKSIERQSPQAGADRYAIAIWVSTEAEQAPLQAIGGWLN